jgi:hypothetical protein
VSSKRASGRPDLGEGQTRMVGPPHLVRLLIAGLMAVFALVALGCLLGAVAALADRQFVAAIVVLAIAGVAAAFTRQFWNRTRRDGPPLLLTCSPGAISFARPGLAGDTVRRDEIGLIVLRAFGRGGVWAVDVYGPDRRLLGRWATHWGTLSGPIRAIRTLRQFDYPWAVHDGLALAAQGRFQSKSAPVWANEVVSE